MLETNRVTKIAEVTLLAVIIVAVLVIGLLYVTSFFPSNTVPPVAEDAPLSTLVCIGAEAKSALTGVMNEYAEKGDAAAFAAAQKQIDTGVCSYNSDYNFYWWQPGTAPEGFEGYEDVACTPLSNGHCLAIQPIYAFDEVDEQILWSGYMLVEPRITEGEVPQATAAARLQQGLIFDMNY
ncbi:hypothetical protein KC722_00460 [Candidatus Kaiserbacteria bacterium]|nr:hypothetical protein [Candidatus Kaiserbacteria bacterium]